MQLHVYIDLIHVFLWQVSPSILNTLHMLKSPHVVQNSHLLHTAVMAERYTFEDWLRQ